jgi:hypothetical protein
MQSDQLFRAASCSLEKTINRSTERSPNSLIHQHHLLLILSHKIQIEAKYNSKHKPIQPIMCPKVSFSNTVSVASSVMSDLSAPCDNNANHEISKAQLLSVLDDVLDILGESDDDIWDM